MSAATVGGGSEADRVDERERACRDLANYAGWTVPPDDADPYVVALALERAQANIDAAVTRLAQIRAVLTPPQCQEHLEFTHPASQPCAEALAEWNAEESAAIARGVEETR